MKGGDRSVTDKGTTNSNATLEVDLKTIQVMVCKNYGEQSNMEGEDNTWPEMDIVLANSYDKEFKTNKPLEPSPRHESIPPHIVHHSQPRTYPTLTYPVKIQRNWFSETSTLQGKPTRLVRDHPTTTLQGTCNPYHSELSLHWARLNITLLSQSPPLKLKPL